METTPGTFRRSGKCTRKEITPQSLTRVIQDISRVNILAYLVIGTRSRPLNGVGTLIAIEGRILVKEISFQQKSMRLIVEAIEDPEFPLQESIGARKWVCLSIWKARSQDSREDLKRLGEKKSILMLVCDEAQRPLLSEVLQCNNPDITSRWKTGELELSTFDFDYFVRPG